MSKTATADDSFCLTKALCRQLVHLSHMLADHIIRNLVLGIY